MLFVPHNCATVPPDKKVDCLALLKKVHPSSNGGQHSCSSGISGASSLLPRQTQKSNVRRRGLRKGVRGSGLRWWGGDRRRRRQRSRRRESCCGSPSSSAVLLPDGQDACDFFLLDLAMAALRTAAAAGGLHRRRGHRTRTLRRQGQAVLEQKEGAFLRRWRLLAAAAVSGRNGIGREEPHCRCRGG